jgi:hypothetical protein
VRNDVEVSDLEWRGYLVTLIAKPAVSLWSAGYTSDAFYQLLADSRAHF